MILDSHSGLRGKWFDAETGAPVRWVRWYDTETTEYEAFRSDPEEAKRRGLSLRPLLYRGRRRLRLEPGPSAPPSRPMPPKPATPLSVLRRELLPGLKPVLRKPLLWLPGGVPVAECDEPGCHQPGIRSVVDEMLVEPEGPCERALAVRDRVYCDKHFRLPTQLSLRGVQSEIDVPVRPQ